MDGSNLDPGVDVNRLLQLMFEKSPDYLFVSDNNFNIIKANEAFMLKIGTDAALGKECSLVIKGGCKTMVNEVLKSKLTEDQVSKTIKKCCLFKGDPQNSWYEISTCPLRNELGTIILTAFHIRDISQEKILEEKLAEQNSRLWILHDVDKLMHSAIEIKELLDLILRGIVKLGYNSASLFLVVEDQNILEGMTSTTLSREEMNRLKINLNNKRGFLPKIVRSKEPLYLEDIEDTPIQVKEEVKKAIKGKSVLGMPLIIEDKVKGVILIDDLKEFELRDEDLQILQLFISKAATTINRAELYDRQYKFNQELKRKIEQATLELKSKNAKLKELDKTKTALLSVVSHELKTPLTSIKGYSSLFRSGKFGKISNDQTNILNVIINEANKLNDVICDVIDLSKLVSGQEGLNPERVDIGDIIKDSILEMEPLAAEKNVDLIFLSKGIEHNISLDPNKIRSAMKQLISNAIKFNKIGGEVNISLKEHEHFVQINVKDTGKGIPEEELEKIFEQFYQLEEHMTKTVSGSGVGLSIVKEIINLHQGDVWVKSVPGNYTEFSFTIPKKISVLTTKKDEDDLLKALTELETMRTILNIIHGDVKLYDTLQLILESIKETIGFDRIRLYLLNHEEQKLHGAVAINGPVDFDEMEISTKDQKFWQDVFTKRKAIIYYRYKNEEVNKKLSMNTDTPFTAMPIIVRDKAIGIIAADNVLSHKIITAKDREMFTTFVDSAAIAIANATMMQEAENLVEERTRALQDINIVLQNKDRQKDDFLNYVSHELRTPLTSLIGYSKLLMTRDLNETQRKSSIKIIHKESQRLKRMIDDLLDLNKLEEGMIEMKKIPSNIYQITGEVLDIMRPTIDTKRIKADIVGDRIPGLLEFDKEKIKQVLINLISNSLKFTLKGTITILIKDQKDHVRVSVKDTGVGIAQKDFDKIFNKFKQIDNGLRTEKGSGLGLVISKHIVEAHGGDIWFESKLGEGTTFHFSLPK
jgi:PAS domain S-box-containing protein